MKKPFFHVLAVHEKSMTICLQMSLDVIFCIMQWHIYFNRDLKSIILNSTSLLMWNLWSITASNRDWRHFFLFNTYRLSLITEPHACETNHGPPSLRLGNLCVLIRFAACTYEICFLLFVNVKFVLFVPPWQLQNQPSELQSLAFCTENNTKIMFSLVFNLYLRLSIRILWNCKLKSSVMVSKIFFKGVFDYYFTF